jgi:hypothetical protein
MEQQGGTALRRRAVQNLQVLSPREPHVETKLEKSLKRFDAYAKVDADLTVKTDGGATVSLAFWVLLVLLLLGEMGSYFASRRGTLEHLKVDTSVGRKLDINVNITFHAINCLDLHVDAMDVAGDNQLDVEHSMVKQRLSPTGKFIGSPLQESISEEEHRLTLPANYCGSCYGAESSVTPDEDGRQCCNTCFELIDAYLHKGWSSLEIKKTAEQCLRESVLEMKAEDGEGCNLSGVMKVNKVAGNFHMAMGESMVKDGRHIHLFDIDECDTFNISHTIHSLSFGDQYPGMRPNPLDGTSKIMDKETGTGLLQYYLNVVPTMYDDGPEGADDLVTSQFAYTYKFLSVYGYEEVNPHAHEDLPGKHHDAHGQHTGDISEEHKKKGITTFLLPGVFFVYDISPFILEVAVTHVPFSHLIIRMCAIAGGIFTVSGLLDGLVFWVANHMKHRGFLPS